MNKDVYSLEARIGRFLRWGVLVAAALMVLGWVPQISFHGNPLLAFAQYQSEPLPHRIAELTRSGHWDTLLCYAGLVVLLGLPAIRVFLTGVIFITEGDYALAASAGFVFCVLILSLFLGLSL